MKFVTTVALGLSMILVAVERAAAQAAPSSQSGRVARFVTAQGILEVERIDQTRVEFSWPLMDGPGTGRQSETSEKKSLA